MIYALALAAALVAPAWAGTTLPDAEAASWLQRMSDASRKLPYEGIFVMQMGDSMHSVHDLLPVNATPLVQHYRLQLGGTDRVAGQECRLLELVPKDQYRWGYVLCAEQYTGLPLKAVMVGGDGQPLVQYSFVKVRQGAVDKPDPDLPGMVPADDLRPVDVSPILVRQLPPGYAKVAAIKRKLPNRIGEVEHWVFSDGLNHISMFVEPAPKKAVSIKGQSTRGMMNLLTRKLGRYQVTVLGDAPWPAVEIVAMNLAVR